MSFADLGLIPELLQAVAETGYTDPTPIQAQAIPVVLAGQDVMGGAQTGTGKTAGFTLPLLQRIAPKGNTSNSPARHPVRALIIAPTRELAIQVHESVRTYSKFLPLRSACIYGGVDIKPQIAELRAGVEVVVCTPGRLLDHIEQRSIAINQVEILVLDEADRMLDMGFLPDIRRILGMLPATRQSLLFSATFSEDIKKLADTMLRSPTLIEVARRNTVSETIRHIVHPVSSGMKRDLLAHLISNGNDGLGQGQTLVFVSTKDACGRLSGHLQRAGIAADAIHGDKSQIQRSEALEAFKNGTTHVLVATDVAARGLDIDDLPYVVNYELPGNPEDYVHRIGRTGRAGKSGTAVSLVAPEEQPKLSAIEKLIKLTISLEVVEGFGPDATEAPRRSSPRSSEGRPARESRPERAPREGARESRDSRPTRTAPARKQSMIAADGFDFSRPYEGKSVLTTETDAANGAQPVSKRNKEVSFLFGGRKPD